MHERELRVGDAERDAVARQLREHWALGRLDADELEERLEASYRARTRGDLDTLVDDLPELESAPARPQRRMFLPGVAAFHEERRLRASVRDAYDSAWREIVPRLALRGYFVEDQRPPARLHFVSDAGHAFTVTFRPGRTGDGTIVTAFGHAPRAIRKAFATLRD